ncbi:hypothetical protein C3K47_12450 [Solitalea longa]|uniref:DUF306 domain-containing protein n=1 Tax=Solitalea longa TaxID=2079460 RepID=A0A2S5A157_9SPHI|nr:META domain-containing protein [Solitalea longa]POY36007.1 hypothetical protein C3K47_12450 [Solitalea longa]
MKSKILFTAFLISIVWSGCNTVKTSGLITPENISALVGHRWNLSQLISNGNVIDIGKENIPFMEFTKENKVSGSLGCNNITGGYKFEEGKLKLSPMATTQKICPDMKVEDAFSKALGETTDFKMNEGKLQLFKGKDLLASFSK